ncbi:MAG: TonB-dependent receptor plug domain-containing protein [Spirosomataceae bacterium]
MLFFSKLEGQRYLLRLVHIIGIFCLYSTTFAQKEVSLCEVTIKGIRPERFMIGQKVQEIDSAKLARNSFSTMADFLQFQSPIAFKSYGAGQITSISFRGTSSSHTALLWNGVNINFPSLGQTDFSTIPVVAFDQMTIQYGSAASCVGTDAVGGSIQLRSVPQFKTEGFQGLFAIRAETSENFSSQIGLKFYQSLNKNWKFSGKTLIYGSTFKNNFGIEPISDRKGRTYNVEPIHTTQKGVVQDLYLQHKSGDLLSLNLWVTDNNLTIQPDVISLREITRTQAYRMLGSYQLGKTLIRTGFIRDITDYGRGENTNPSHTEIDRFIFRTEHDFSWIRDCARGTNLKIGGEFVHFDARVDGYGDNLKQENRFDVYALLRHQFSSKFSSSINLRQAFITGYNPPFTPSAGVEYDIYRKGNTRITVPANVAFSYRVPTLNERYWVNLGNPDIKPEQGFNKEGGITWQQRFSDATQTKLGFTAFHNLIDNWTYWNPDRGYRVENLQQVLSKGIEIEFTIKTQIKSTQLNADVQYALTNSSQQKEFGLYTKDILGKQLIYVPRHAISSTISASRKGFSASIQQMFNSERHITFDHTGLPFPPYYLLNLILNYQKKIKNNQFDLVIQGNNLTNTLYPNLKKNAMPMRSFAMSLIVHLQK